MPERSFRMLLWTIALVGIGLDQTTKYGIFAWLKSVDGQNYQVHEGKNGPSFALQARYLTDADGKPTEPQVNSGALFGLGGDYKELANNGFAIISLLAALAIVCW